MAVKKKFSDMTKEELSQAGKEGNKRSQEVKRAKKNMKAVVEQVLTLALKDTDVIDADDVKSLAELNGQNIDVQTAIVLAQVKKALKGSVMSAEFIRDTSGQRPEDVVQLQSEEDTDLNINIHYNKPKEEKEDKDKADKEKGTGNKKK